MNLRSIRWYVALLIGAIMLPFAAGAQGQPKLITLGSDLTAEQQEAMLQLFQANRETDQIFLVTTDEMRAAMQEIIPIPEGYTSVSSTALTCGAPGSGLTVRTENITRVSASMYTIALITAGVGDANLVVAAPPEAPGEGMTALTGFFKSLENGGCGRGSLDPTRRQLALRQLALINDMANAIGGDLTQAADFMLRSQRVLIRENNNPDAAVPIVEGVQRDTGVTLPQQQFDALVFLLATIGQAKVDWGTYASNWELQMVSDNEVRAVPGGSGGNQTGAAQDVSNQTLTGTVSGTNPLRIRVPTANTGFTLNANNVRVIRNDRNARLDDLQPGDQVIINVGPNNAVRQISATSADASGGDGPARIVRGVATSIENGTISLNTPNGKQDFAARGVPVTRNERSSTLSAIQPNDEVVVELGTDGQPQAIRANSPGGAPSRLGRWAPLLLVALLLLCLIPVLWMLFGRRRRPTLLVERNRRTVLEDDDLDALS